MNDAIEVLKDMIEFDGEYVPKIVLSKSEHYSDELFKKQQIALKEALLALEQKEKLIEWLEKEIRAWEDYLKITKDQQARVSIRRLKEVLERLVSKNE